jgi:hypothetical protein
VITSVPSSFSGWRKAAGVAGRDHHTSSGCRFSRSSRPSSAAGQVGQVHAVLVEHQLVLARAMAGEEHEQDVLAAIHARAERGERFAKLVAVAIGALPTLVRLLTRAMVRLAGAEALGELLAHELDLAPEHFLRARRRRPPAGRG